MSGPFKLKYKNSAFPFKSPLEQSGFTDFLSKMSTMGGKELIKKGVKKIVSKGASKLIPGIGATLATADILKEGVTRVKKDIETGVPQTKLTGENIADTFRREEKKTYI